MKKTILFILLSVFALSSFADFRFRVNAINDNNTGWEDMDYSAPGTTDYVYATYKKVDPELSEEENYSSITVSIYNKTTKKESNVNWAYWKSTNTGTQSSGRNHEGRYYKLTKYPNATFCAEDGTTRNAIVWVYYFPSRKIYNIAINLLDCGRVVRTFWYKN